MARAVSVLFIMLLLQTGAQGKNKSVSTGRLSDLSISCLIGNIVEMGDDFSSCDSFSSIFLSLGLLCPFHPHLVDLLWHSLTKSGFTLPIRVKAFDLFCQTPIFSHEWQCGACVILGVVKERHFSLTSTFLCRTFHEHDPRVMVKEFKKFFWKLCAR